jgi:RNA 2',3'-cyclic 3'-phosphodiesterase
MEPKPRLFVAVPLPEEIRAPLGRTLEQLKERLPFQKWVHPSDLHITLKFLGETEVGLTVQITEALERAASDAAAFKLGIGAMGVFGRSDAPSVLWSEVTGELQKLSQLQSRVEKAMEALGFTAEQRPYKPHLTLARRYQGQAGWKRELLEQNDRPEVQAGLWTVSGMVLYRSRLGRQPMYEPVVSIPLTIENAE